VCKRDRATHIPAGGDGSLRVMSFHHGPTSFDATRCPGVGRGMLPLRMSVEDEVSRRA